MNNKRKRPLIIRVIAAIMIPIVLLGSFAMYIPAKPYVPQEEMKVSQSCEINNFIDNYEKALSKEGFIVSSIDFKYDTQIKTNSIKDCFDVKIKTKKLILTDTKEEYIFKNETSCQDFINRLKDYNIKYEIQDVVLNKQQITKAQTLNDKIEKLETKKKEQEIAKRKAEARSKVSSRSGSMERSTAPAASFNSIPLETYTYISSRFGEKSSRRSSYHTGTDYAAPYGTKIYAWKDGTISLAKWNGSYGNMVAIEHDNNIVTRYGHMSKIAVSTGQTVKRGQIIGYVGSTGNSTGNHLHIEFLVKGSFVNPENYLR